MAGKNKSKLQTQLEHSALVHWHSCRLTYLIACSEFPIIPLLFHTRLSASCRLRLFSEENILFLYSDVTD